MMNRNVSDMLGTQFWDLEGKVTKSKTKTIMAELRRMKMKSKSLG